MRILGLLLGLLLATGAWAQGADNPVIPGGTPGSYPVGPGQPITGGPAQGGLVSNSVTTAFVQENCAAVSGQPCYQTIQGCIDALETSNPDGTRICYIHPRDTTDSAAPTLQTANPYIEDISCDASDGHTLLEGLGHAAIDSTWVFSNQQNASVWVRAATDAAPTITMSACTVRNLLIEQFGAGPAVRIANEDDKDQSWLVRNVIVGEQLIISAGDILTEITSDFGFVLMDDNRWIGICIGADAASSVIQIDSDNTNINARLRLSGGKISLEGNCPAGSSAVRMVSTYPETEFNMVQLGCEGSGTCVEAAGAAVDANFYSINIAFPIAGPTTQGRLVDIQNASATVRFSQVSGLDDQVFTLNNILTAAYQGHLEWFGQGVPSAAAPTQNCVAGDVFHRNDGGAGTSLYVCEVTGSPGTWAAK